MRPKRAPWWIFICAGLFVTYFALIIYNTFGGPEPAGMYADYRDNSMVLREILPDTPAERAGLRAGDRIVAVNGQAIRNLGDWLAIRSNLEVDRPAQLEVERESRRLNLDLTLGRNSWERWDAEGKISFFAIRSGQFVMLVLALFIVFNRPYDLAARVGAWLLAAFATSNAAPPYGFAALWRQLPAPLGVALWIPAFSALMLGAALLFTFFAIFPRKLFHARKTWVLLWSPMLAASAATMYYFAFPIIYRPEHVTGRAPNWLFTAVVLLFVAYIVAAMVALVVNYRRLDDANERRRVRVLLAGMLLGWVPALPLMLLTYVPALSGLAVSYSFPVVWISLFVVFPLSFAYAILRHRMFDIRVIIRQGLQYAVARRLLLSLVPALGVLLVLDLLLHGDQPLLQVLRARGWVYGVLGVGALLAHRQRRQWMQSLDRHFFREHYNAQLLLGAMVEEIRVAGSLDQVAPHLVERIETALHPEFTALMVRLPQQASYQALAVAPSGQALPALAADSKLVALVRLLGKPLEISLGDTGWLREQLPHHETDFLRQARIDLVVPIATAPNRTDALLALGMKRSEEPYSREDQELLLALAAALALLLERPASSRAADGFEECPQCGSCYDSGASRCSSDGAALSPATFSRLLAGRYRLECRLGRGGMGMVYRANDASLERNVAVKLVRDELLASPEAAERFRRESRMAASFTHPNLVTVYDFGVGAGTRAFLVMELLDGTTLRRELETRKRLPAGQTLEVLRGICAGVEVAHQRQLVHRDLKPENIFLVRAGSAQIPKVLDFGVAKFLPNTIQATADTGAGVLVGTVQYMAPEQLRGESVDPAWDIWALAVMTYEMLAGAHPFGQGPACHSAILSGRFTPIDTYLPEAPSRYQDFFSRAFVIDRQQRPDSVEALFSEIGAALS